MKKVFYIFCIVSLSAVGFTFYLTAEHNRGLGANPTPSKPGILTKGKKVQEVQIATEPSPSVQKTPSTTEKDCACCAKKIKDAREYVKQKRQALEEWARKTIDIHGREEGLKLITAKSPALAKRMQQVLETEKSTPTHVASQSIP